MLTYENNTLDKEDCCAVLCPREVYPNVIKFAKMWKPRNIVEVPKDYERNDAEGWTFANGVRWYDEDELQ